MAVLLETSLGDLTIDLFVDDCPTTTKNFLKLCKIKYYNNCLFHNIQKNYLIQTGDPTNTGKGGESIYGLLFGDQAKYFQDEIKPHLKHTKKGTVSMANAGPNLNGSQFFITVSDGMHQLDEKHTIFGIINEGIEVVQKISEIFATDEGKALQAVRIKHTIILDDPFEDPSGLEKLIPDRSPLPSNEQMADILDEEEAMEIGKPKDEKELEVLEELQKEKEAQSREQVLEFLGDIPDAEMKPPENVLFVCKLNPVTTEEDLEVIFSRFGEIRKVEVIRDWKTGDSLCYSFIEFATREACEQAYYKMDNVSIDDRRIHVDFSQSLSRQAISKDGRLVNTFGFNFMKKMNPSIDQKNKNSKETKDSDLKVKDNSRSRGNYSLVFDEEEDQQPSRHSSKKHKDAKDSEDRVKDRSRQKTTDHEREYKHDRSKDRKRDERESKRDRERDRDHRHDERDHKKRKH